MKHSPVRAMFLAGLLLACGPAAEDTAPLGTWVVTDHTMPGISAMSREEADEWLGRMAAYSRSRASFDGEVCASARYESGTISGEEFLGDFRVPSVSLGLDPESISMVRVYCGDSEWIAPGAVLFRPDESRMVTIWDGVFFILQKESSSPVR